VSCSPRQTHQISSLLLDQLISMLMRTTSYSVFRRVVNYYSDDPTGMSESGEDAFDMRKPCSRDKKLEHVRDKGEDFLVNPEDVS
jgi:hypothetical protein